MSKSTDNWMPLWIGDYLADTMHLSATEHGAYLLLLMHAWRSGPLPNDDRQLASIARVEMRVWSRNVGAAVKAFFAVGEDGRLYQKRLEAERKKAGEISDKRRDAASKRHANKGANPPPSPPNGGSKPDANAGANAGANGQQNLLQNGSILPPPSPSKEELSQAKPDSVPPAHTPARDPTPLMPRLSDPHHRWAHLGDGEEIDTDGSRHPLVAGFYLDVICGLVCEAAGINDANWRGDWRPVIAWLRDGIDPHEQIVPAIRRAASRPNYRPSEIRSLAYFDAAVRGDRRVA